MIDELVDAFEDLAEARRELAKMRGEYTGYSPSYHLDSWYEAESKARERVGRVLDEYIDSRIKGVLR